MEHTFSGRWITLPHMADAAPIDVFHREQVKAELTAPLPENQHMLFRQTFRVQTNGRVLLYITADDYCKVYINGTFVTQGPAPGYPFHYYYNAVDITDYVQPGENCIAVHAYYQGLINRVWVSGDGRAGLLYDIVQENLCLAKSGTDVKCTLHGAFSALGTVGYRTQFMEQYDSRAKEVGFEKPDFDDSAWEKAALCKYADYTLVAQPTKQLSAYAVKPEKLEKIPGGYRIDFGRIYVGALSAVGKGKSGQMVLLHFGQELTEEGNVRFSLRARCIYEEKWILSGKTDTLVQYDYKSFRYVEILCEPECEITDIKMIVRHYPFRAVRGCAYKDEKLQKIWKLAADSLHYGVQEVIQDCMEREKAQYLADACLTAPALAVLTNDTSILEKVIDDALCSAFINGGLMACTTCSYMQEMAEAPLMLPYLLLFHSFLKKDTMFAKTRYAAVCDVVDYYGKTYGGADGLLRNVDKWCVVDWPQAARDGYDVELEGENKVARGLHNVINAVYIGAVKMLRLLADRLGEPPCRDAFPLENAFIRAFYDKERGMFCDSESSRHISLPANAYALLFGLCPDKQTEERVVNMIMEKDASASAFFISHACLWALARLGRKQEMQAFIQNEGRWLRMLREGATATSEAWGKDGKWNTSLFHLTYSYVALFLTEWGMDDFLAELSGR